MADENKKPEEQEDQLTPEDLKEIDSDLEKLKSSYSSEVIDKARKEGKDEAAKEFQIKKELEEKDRKIKELEENMKKQQESASKAITDIQEKVNTMTTSKAFNPNPEDPFQRRPDQGNNVLNIENMSDEQINEIEENSAKLFWGKEQYLRMRREG